TNAGRCVMLSFMWWLVIGVVAGGLARLMMPGRQSMGLLATMLLGLVGSVVGGYLSSLFYGYDPSDPGFHAGGLILSTIGAVLVLLVYLKMVNTRTNP
ncbi:MAG: GlsB/YeaQ/YmgE family stress response membrane protein, partial [Planctomycetota bacterium]|nr:GlsB/YeaQ/YmgE family stress response membrane protein [Planctomycetota bacterium]